jgi:hypothetical protein
MPEDKMVHQVLRPNGRPATYARARISHNGETTEIWGWSILCYRKVKQYFISLGSMP